MADRRQRFAVLKVEGERYIYVRGSLPAEKILAGSTITFEVIKNDDKPNALYNLFYEESAEKKMALGSFYKQNWWDDEPQMLYFVNLRNALVFYELDFWSCHRVREIVSEVDGSGEIAAVLELRDSSRPTAWPSERMHRMHEIMTEDMTAIMVKNLTTTASSAGNGGKRHAVESLSGEPLSVQISENYRKLPLNMPANSPHAVRLSHVRRSIYNAGLDTLRDFDEKTRHWEVDLAASDMIGWKTTVKAMVTSVATAIISTVVDERKIEELELGEMVAARLLQPHQRPYSQGQYVRESAMAALWDCGLAEMYPGFRPGGSFDDPTRASQIEAYLTRLTSDLASSETLAENDKKALQDLLEKDRVKKLFRQPATYKSKLYEVTEKRRARALRQVSEGPPSMHSEAEMTFANAVWEHFKDMVDVGACLTLLAYNAELPIEGLGYTPPNVHFGVCSFDQDGNLGFSLGHGVGLMVEATEIAVAFLQESDWARSTRARAQSANSTVDKPIGPDGIDVDSPAGNFPADTEELLCNPVALETYVAPPDKTDDSKALPYDVLTQPKTAQRRELERAWWKRAPPQSESVVPVPGTSNAVFVNKGIEKEATRQIVFLNCFLTPADLAKWMALHFVGGVFERQSVLERPVFAKLNHKLHIERVKKTAHDNGFIDLAEGADGATFLYSAMKHEISEHTATGRRMHHLLQPFLVSVTSISCRSYMMLENYWGPKRDFFAVEAESCFIFREVCNSLFRSSAQRMAADNVGTLGEKAYLVGFHRLSELLDHVRNEEKRKTAAGIAVRLIEAVQSSNESIKDSGKVHRQKEARAHVDMSRTGYATLLAKIRVN
jgi:hypothetical protein